MKAAKKDRRKKPNSATGAGNMVADVASTDVLRVLATATTAYHEAPPERFEEARLAYEEALKRFQSRNPVVPGRAMAAGSGAHLHGCD